MTHARHAKPASRTKRTLTGAGETLAVLAVLALAAFGIATVADAATTPQTAVHCQREWGHNPGQRDHWHVFCQPAAPHYPTRGYARTCAAFARWNAAGIPSWGQLRTLAHSAAVMRFTLPDDTLRADVAALVLTIVGHTDGSPPAVTIAHDCGND